MEGSKCCFSIKNGSQYFKQFNDVFSAEIDEVDIIPCIKSEEPGTCPIVVDGNKIGILSWCVKKLFCFAYNELMEFKKINQKDLIKEGSYMMELSRAILLLTTAEDYTVWNLRKQYIIANESSRNAEMNLSALVLKKHPRSSETFAHRRWLIKDLAAKNEFPTSSIPLAQELHLCLQCAERYCDNYVAWSQRCWLISQFMSDDVEKLLQELQEIKQWLWMHISDYCCFHYRQQLLKHLKKICSSTEMEEILLEESSMMDEILRRYPGHETVWYHRRFLIDYWLSMNPPCDNCLLYWQSFEKQTSVGSEKHNMVNSRGPKCRNCNSLQNQCSKNLLPNYEMCYCRKIIEVSNGQSAELKRQSHFAASQLEWLHHFLQSKYFTGLVQQGENLT